jgi:hypothetical protein
MGPFGARQRIVVAAARDMDPAGESQVTASGQLVQTESTASFRTVRKHRGRGREVAIIDKTHANQPSHLRVSLRLQRLMHFTTPFAQPGL